MLWFVIERLRPAVFMLVVLTCSCSGRAQQATGLDGKPADPLKLSSGKAAVLIFIRTDCPISNRYAPAIQRLSAQYGDKVAFWLVYPDKDELPSTIQNHLDDYGYKLPALRDPEHALVKQAHAQVTPEAAVFDSKGQLIYHGRIDNWYERFGNARAAPTTHELADALDAALAGKSSALRETTPVGCYISDLQ
jgi:hypothetical protein